MHSRLATLDYTQCKFCFPSAPSRAIIFALMLSSENNDHGAKEQNITYSHMSSINHFTFFVFSKRHQPLRASKSCIFFKLISNLSYAFDLISSRSRVSS